MITIKDILIELNIAFTEDGHNGWIQTSCPDCGNTSSQGRPRYYLGIHLHSGAASCWRCGKKNTAHTIASLSSRPEREIRQKLDNMPVMAPVARKKGRLELPSCAATLLPGHKAYLMHRGMKTAEVTLKWSIKGIGQANGKWRYLRWRLFIPIYHHGEVVSWTTRAINPSAKQRYLSASSAQEAVPHKSILYGADYARHTIIIHEGPLDVWATGPGAVAVCGISYTEAQLAAMSRYARRVVCFDAEIGAQRRAEVLANALSAFQGETYNVSLETGKDAAEADPAEVSEIRQKFLG